MRLLVCIPPNCLSVCLCIYSHYVSLCLVCGIEWRKTVGLLPQFSFEDWQEPPQRHRCTLATRTGRIHSARSDIYVHSQLALTKPVVQACKRLWVMNWSHPCAGSYVSTTLTESGLNVWGNHKRTVLLVAVQTLYWSPVCYLCFSCSVIQETYTAVSSLLCASFCMCVRACKWECIVSVIWYHLGHAIVVL